ncbi:hypothetical protein HUJ05_004661 [Dendroctonus ponderosae]|nr:hypothetical protein HUJ05_008615 [Dendroctonus ponderosae]KAH1010357.1 hypothetical protein HUJ05_004661 [Dendroctonus ponderosae]
MALSQHLSKSRQFLAIARNYSAAASLVNVEVNDKSGVAVVTLQRPPVNSLNLELLTEIKQTLTGLEKNKSRGAIITSAFKTFSAGLDILEMYKPNPDRAKEFWTTLQDVWISLYSAQFPTVALINGPAPAGGCLLSLCCEYRIMVPKAVIGLNETQLGIVAPSWFAASMENVIGKRQTELALTTGKLFTTDEALKVGLIDEVVQTKEEGLEKAQGFIGSFARISPFARSLSKQTVRGGTIRSMVKGREADLQLFLATIQQDQVQKGLGLYIEALKKKVLVTLSKHLWECNVPLLVCRSIGFLGYVRLQIKEHTIIEAHPDSESPDLRLDIPWPALQEYLDGVNIEQLDQKEKNHVPPPVILRYYLNKYKESHEGKLPEKRVEKEALKQMIRDSGNSEEGKQRFVLDENFEQAIHYANSCVTTRAVPDHVQVILDDDCCTNLTQSSSSFWIMCAALREMVEAEGALPVRGTLPDMAADTNSYVTLQNIYQKRAQQQVEVIYRRASQIARNLGLSQETITESEVKYFCKHSSELHLIRGTCIADEYQKTNLDLTAYLEDPDSLIFYYVVLRGLERFIGEFNAYPGQFEDQVEPDILKLKGVIGKLLSEWGYSHALREERVYEVCRYGTAELHSVSSILGGCAAQEVIKVITNQYKPLNNIFIYDGINCTSASFCL